VSEHVVVPVDRRWLGMDKRGIPYAVVAVLLMVLLTRVVPAIDDAMTWSDPVRAGDVMDLGSGIRITPPVGWQVVEGVRVGAPIENPVSPGSARVAVVDGTTQIGVTGGAWDGTADDLLSQSNRIRVASDAGPDKLFKVTGDRYTFTTSSGIVGVAEPFTSESGDGTDYAFVVTDATGKQIGLVVSVRDSDATTTPDDQIVRDAVSSLTVVKETS
jgi:hypothetical protein